MSDSLAELFLLADAFCAAKSISESTLSGMLLKGGNRLRDLRARNADIGVRRLDEAIRWFSEHWPVDVAWPKAVARPAPAVSRKAS